MKNTHYTKSGFCCACEADIAFMDKRMWNEALLAVKRQIKAKLKRNDNNPLKAGLLYALTVIEGTLQDNR